MKNIENKHVLCVNVSCSNELTEKVVDDVGNQLSDKMSDEPGKELSNELSNEQRYDESNEPGNVMYFDESKEPGNVLSYDENNQQFYDESNELIPHEKRKDEKAFPWLQPVECLEEQSEDYPKQNTGKIGRASCRESV